MIEDVFKTKKVKDIRKLIVDKPSLISPDASIDELLQKIVEDTRTRHIYVVDENKKLLGAIRLIYVIEYLFPGIMFFDKMESILGSSFMGVALNKFNISCVRDIMNDSPVFVFEDTTIPEMIELMDEEKIGELPVLNSQKQVIGEVNVLEIIEYYLRFIKSENETLA